jgi:hypothetical protein
VNEEWPPHVLASEITSEQRFCIFCHAPTVKGFTNKGNPSWFDPVPPYPNHWVTCTERDLAARYFRRNRKARPRRRKPNVQPAPKPKTPPPAAGRQESLL